ncbi:unnamed protein product [Gongylonema pulchrum]|uniref:Protein SDA1 n=1 Tax=Gongylonema pulchrum TaxID=637853 RepID=A0A183D3K8_9BILA|nr:unnamed protein product [Gongylonema pulchrum]
MEELKRRRSGVDSSDDSSDDGDDEGEGKRKNIKRKKKESNDGKTHAGDILIFTPEFIAFNKAQESKLKKLRRMVKEKQEEANYWKEFNGKLSHRLDLLRKEHEQHWVIKTKKRWAKLLIGALAYVAIDDEYPTVANIDNYMEKLKRLVTEKPDDKNLIAIRMALSEVNFN